MKTCCKQLLLISIFSRSWPGFHRQLPREGCAVAMAVPQDITSIRARSLGWRKPLAFPAVAGQCVKRAPSRKQRFQYDNVPLGRSIWRCAWAKTANRWMYSLKIVLICTYTELPGLLQGFFFSFQKQSAPSLTESISVLQFRLLSLENKNFSIGAKLPIPQAGCGKQLEMTGPLFHYQIF